MLSQRDLAQRSAAGEYVYEPPGDNWQRNDDNIVALMDEAARLLGGREHLPAPYGHSEWRTFYESGAKPQDFVDLTYPVPWLGYEEADAYRREHASGEAEKSL